MGARVSGPIEQGNFLGNLGIEKRAATLKSLASPRSAPRSTAPQTLAREGRTEMVNCSKSLVSRTRRSQAAGFEPEPSLSQDRHAASAVAVQAYGIRHGFFTRVGGVSDGIYQSLNGGVGSEDSPAKVAENAPAWRSILA